MSSHPIAKALEDAAKRVGKTLSRDASEAVSQMYHQAGRGTEQVVKNIAEAEASHTKQIVALAERIAKNSGETGKGARKRLVRQADARSRLNSAVGGRSTHDVELIVDSAKYPESARHIQEAQSGTVWSGSSSRPGAPKPSIVKIDRNGADTNRADSLRGIPTSPPQDRDEYPPAMFEEGGTGASVKYISASDNQGSGSAMGSALRNLPKGTRVKITVR